MRPKSQTETKTRVHSISLTPTDYTAMKKILSVKQLKFNTVVGKMIQEYISENKHLVEVWDKTFGEL